ncbi:CcdC family protein [Paenibacillus hamazuiensis]|uniref:CcdC family protein n=1 Tax=Paenibacillus hamazuiensis TaxID=2936508 RepID=UPI00200E0BF3|nr:cytochrome c biogenesis protein CcdC [Paenibacillus hamazuiensis]
MTYIHWPSLQTAVTFGAIGMAIMAMFLRLRAGGRPVTVRKIVIPPLGMSTGFLMFAFPMTHIPWLWALLAFAAGACVFAVPLIMTTRFQVTDGQVYVQQSKQFMVILLGLLVLRLALHSYIEEYISIAQTGAVFFILAFGMILPWRAAMLIRYRRLLRSIR